MVAFAVFGALLTRPVGAVVAPITDASGHTFVAPAEGIQAISVHSVLRQPASGPWEVDVELWLRNARPVEVSTSLAVVLPNARVFVNGQPVDATPLTLRQDPARPEHTYRSAARIDVTMAPETVYAVRVVAEVSPTIDALGRAFIEVPTQALALFEGTIHGGTMVALFRERPIAGQSTIPGATLYDEPENRMAWQLREWEPGIPFRLSYLPPWSALLLVADVEACPAPWPIVQAMSSGDVASVRGIIGTHDASALSFCASLPLVLHGYVFESERVRAQLSAIPLTRYLPGPGVTGTLYRENPSFAPASLSDAESIYRNTLLRFAEERSVGADASFNAPLDLPSVPLPSDALPSEAPPSEAR